MTSPYKDILLGLQPTPVKIKVNHQINSWLETYQKSHNQKPKLLIPKPPQIQANKKTKMTTLAALKQHQISLSPSLRHKQALNTAQTSTRRLSSMQKKTKRVQNNQNSQRFPIIIQTIHINQFMPEQNEEKLKSSRVNTKCSRKTSKKVLQESKNVMNRKKRVELKQQKIKQYLSSLKNLTLKAKDQKQNGKGFPDVIIRTRRILGSRQAILIE